MKSRLKSVWEMLLYAYAEDNNDDSKFMKKYDDNQRKFIAIRILKK